MNIMFLTVSGAAFGVFMHTIGFGVSEKPEIFLPSMFLFFSLFCVAMVNIND
jgi:hypothetical protein